MGCDVNVINELGTVKQETFQSTHPSWGATKDMFGLAKESYVFQSTHPSWGATSGNLIYNTRITNFNPRTHRGVRQIHLIFPTICCGISIHAPIVGCDIMVSESQKRSARFQSTHPSWGATD